MSEPVEKKISGRDNTVRKKSVSRKKMCQTLPTLRLVLVLLVGGMMSGERGDRLSIYLFPCREISTIKKTMKFREGFSQGPPLQKCLGLSPKLSVAIPSNNKQNFSSGCPTDHKSFLPGNRTKPNRIELARAMAVAADLNEMLAPIFEFGNGHIAVRSCYKVRKRPVLFELGFPAIPLCTPDGPSGRWACQRWIHDVTVM